MAELTYLGIENPLGVLGHKVRAVVATEAALGAKVDPHARDARKFAAYHQSDKYVNRLEWLPQDHTRSMVQETGQNREYIVSLLQKQAAHPDVRISFCSSFNSMLKYLGQYCVAHAADTFDTVIVYGHGMPGSVNIGLGKLGIGAPIPFGRDGYEVRKNVREGLGLDEPSQGAPPLPRRTRNIDLANQATWTGLFQGVQNCLSENEDTARFHLFLMGCSVGEQPKHSDTTLQREAAIALKHAIGKSVCVSAPRETITDNHLDHLLRKLVNIRKKCVNGSHVLLKDGVKPAVPLVSFLCPPG